MIDLVVKGIFHITGRGNVLVISLKENGLKLTELEPGVNVIHKGEILTVVRTESWINRDLVGLLVKIKDGE